MAGGLSREALALKGSLKITAHDRLAEIIWRRYRSEAPDKRRVGGPRRRARTQKRVSVPRAMTGLRRHGACDRTDSRNPQIFGEMSGNQKSTFGSKTGTRLRKGATKLSKRHTRSPGGT
jgi:hypothetical protein